MKVLLVGAYGQLGRCLQERVPAEWALRALGRDDLDIRDAAAVARSVAAAGPAIIINAAAYNAVDRAESEPAVAHATNAKGPLYLARAAAVAGARFIHISSDYVFDGRQGTAYAEDAATCPLNVYGRTKRQGERAVLREQPHAMVIRTSWLYSEHGSNFVKALLDLARASLSVEDGGGAAARLPRSPGASAAIQVVDDQVGCPTYAGDLADAVIGLAGLPALSGGVYHYCGAAVLSRYQFAAKIFRQLQGIDAGFAGVALTPVASRQDTGLATRPRYSALSCEKIRAGGIEAKPLSANLEHVVRALWAP